MYFQTFKLLKTCFFSVLFLSFLSIYLSILPPLMNMSIEIAFMKLARSFVGEVYKCHLAKSKVLLAVWKHFLYTAKTHL